MTMDEAFAEVVRCPKCKRFVERGAKCTCARSGLDDMKDVASELASNAKECLWVREYALVFASVAIFGIFIEYGAISELANRHFFAFNLALFVVAVLAVFAVMLVVVTDKARETTPSAQKLLFTLGAALVLCVFAIPFASKGAPGAIASPVLIFLGAILMLIGKFDMNFYDFFCMLLIAVGGLVAVFGPVFDAFGIISGAYSIIVFFAGILMIAFGIVVTMLRSLRELSKPRVYFSLWLVGVFAALSAPFHEAFGISASGDFGTLDFMLIVLGLGVMALGLLLFLVKNARDKRVARLIDEGEAHYLENHYSEAIFDFETALQADKANAGVWLRLGMAHEHLGEYEDALRCFTETLLISSKDPGALAGKGMAQRRLGLHKEALESFDAALAALNANDPGNYKGIAMIHSGRGILLFRMGDDAAALKAFDEALDAYPADTEAMCNKGIVLFMIGKNEESKKCFERVLADYPENSVARRYYDRIVAREKLRAQERKYTTTRLSSS